MSERIFPAGSLLALVLAAGWLGGCEEDERQKERDRQLQTTQQQLQAAFLGDVEDDPLVAELFPQNAVFRP